MADSSRPDRRLLAVAVTIWTFAGAIAIVDPRWHELGEFYPVAVIQSAYFAIGLIGCVALWMVPRLSWRGSIGGAMLGAILFTVAAWRIDASWYESAATAIGAEWADGVRAQGTQHSALVKAAFISAIGVGFVRWYSTAAPATRQRMAIIGSPLVFAGLAGACWILAAIVGLRIGALFARRFADRELWALSGFAAQHSDWTFVVSGAALAILAASWLWQLQARWTAALLATTIGCVIAFVASAPVVAAYSPADAIGFVVTAMCWGVTLGVILPFLCAPAAPRTTFNWTERTAFLVLAVLSLPALMGVITLGLEHVGVRTSVVGFFLGSFLAPLIGVGAVIAGVIAALLPRLRGIRKGQVLAIAAWDGLVGFQLATILKRVFSG